MENTELDKTLEEESRFNRTGKIIKSIGVTLMVLIMLGGVSGIFGYGFWTRKTTGDPHNVVIEYERFLRARKETPMKVTVKGDQSPNGEVQVLIHNHYFSKVDVMRIEPMPGRTLQTGQYTAFCFPVANGPYTFTIEFFVRAYSWGNTHVNIGANQSFYTFNQFIYP